MLEVASDGQRLATAMRVQDRCEACCLKIAKLCKIEDLAMSAFVSHQNQLGQFEDATMMSLRKETQQLLRLTSGCGLYFMFISIVYLAFATWCYTSLDEQDFVHRSSQDAAYGLEIFTLVASICRINIVHALTLLSLAFFLVFFTRKFKILNESHYKQLGCLAIVITVIYILPIFLIGHQAYADAQQSEVASDKTAMNRFADITVFLLVKSEHGIAGLILACAIHFQLYALIVCMLWCALHVRDIAESMQRVKAENAGSYKGLELPVVENDCEEQALAI